MIDPIRLELPEKCRLIAVSDIHTCYRLLDKLLIRADYRPGKDFLVIVGDILEHWHDNINALKYVYELCKNERAYCLKGNNDIFCERMAYSYPYEKFRDKFYYNENSFYQMAKSVGFDNCTFENWLDIRKAVTDKYGDQLEFLRDLPICLETQEHIFVHAGLEDRPDWENTDEIYAITAEWFLRKKNPTDKILIVGHYPTYNYKRACSSNMPVYDAAQRIVDIDGGISIKKNCQMNLLIIEKDGDNYNYSVMWDTPFDKFAVKEDFRCELEPVYVDWSYQKIRLLGERDGLLYLKNEVTGESGYIPKREIYVSDGNISVYQFLSAFPEIRKGESVSVCCNNGKYSFVTTERAAVGWVPSSAIDFSKPLERGVINDMK